MTKEKEYLVELCSKQPNTTQCIKKVEDYRDKIESEAVGGTLFAVLILIAFCIFSMMVSNDYN